MRSIATKTVSVKLDSGTRARLEKVAKARSRSAHWVMREAIGQYIEREENREAFRIDTTNAWKEYQETDLHATTEEVAAWLSTWGAEDESSAPRCHR